MSLLPWRRRPPTALGETLGGAGPPSGITGDVEGAADLLRRRWEQASIDAGAWAGSPAGWAPWVSEWAARQIPTFTAGMRLISSVVMQLPLRQKRGDEIVDPPAAVIANPAPGPNRCPADWVDEYVSDVILYGNHVALLGEPDSTGWPSRLIPLDVTTVSVARDPATLQPVYSIEGWDEIVPADRVFHVAIDKRSGELRGRGALPTLAGALAAALAADAYAGRFFTGSGVPSGVITDSRPNLTQEQADELKGKWLAATGGSPRPVVIPPSTTFTPLALNADQAQLVQARQWDAQTVAMAIGVPPFLLGIESQRHTYTNAETEFGRFIATTIMRLLEPLAQQLTLQCIPRGNVAEFETAALLRPDTQTRASVAISLFAAGIITEAEARTVAGFPPSGGPSEAPAGVGAPPLPAPAAPADPTNADRTLREVAA